MRSPCRECEEHPCKEPQKCDKRWEYVKTFQGNDQLKAVDIDGSYSILPR